MVPFKAGMILVRRVYPLGKKSSLPFPNWSPVSFLPYTSLFCCNVHPCLPLSAPPSHWMAQGFSVHIISPWVPMSHALKCTSSRTRMAPSRCWQQSSLSLFLFTPAQEPHSSDQPLCSQFTLATPRKESAAGDGIYMRGDIVKGIYGNTNHRKNHRGVQMGSLRKPSATIRTMSDWTCLHSRRRETFWH